MEMLGYVERVYYIPDNAGVCACAEVSAHARCIVQGMVREVLQYVKYLAIINCEKLHH